MTEKPKTDWEAIEREYRAGVPSIRKLAERYGISDTAIRKKAKTWDKAATSSHKKGTANRKGANRHSANQGANESAAKVGRPSKYDPRYCEEVLSFMRQGFSLAAFAGKAGIARSTINEWINEHPEFSEAVSQGKAVRLLHWEEAALRVAKTGGGPGTATIIMFGLKNMGGDEWRDKQTHELTGKDGKDLPAAAPQVTFFQLPDNGR